MKDHWKEEKKSTRMTTNVELFSSSAFDLVICFCVIESFWVCADLDGVCEEGSDHIIAAFSV